MINYQKGQFRNGNHDLTVLDILRRSFELFSTFASIGFGRLPGGLAGGTAQADMPPIFRSHCLKGTRTIQNFSAFNCRFFTPNSR